MIHASLSLVVAILFVFVISETSCHWFMALSCHHEGDEESFWNRPVSLFLKFLATVLLAICIDKYFLVS